MRISNIQLIEEVSRFKLLADCSTDSGANAEIYFEFDLKFRSYANDSASSFAAALLLPSMKLGEDLIIEGPVSKKLLLGMQEIMAVVDKWGIGLNPINIVTNSILEDEQIGDDVVTTFSGGVDSFYSWLNHKKDASPVKTMMFINGFDISLDNKDLYERTVDNIKNIADEEGAKLIEAESNIRSFIDPILDWGISHGGCLAATALCLSKGIRTMYIPSSYTVEQEHPWGSHRLLDNLWSTEAIDFIHDGYDTSRVNKVVLEVGRSDTALKYLRVCWKEEDGQYNCGRCNKCLRTMVNLYVAGSLKKSKTFPHNINTTHISNSIIDDADDMFIRENIQALKNIDGGEEIIDAYEKSLSRSHRRSRLRSIFRPVRNFDSKYLSGLSQRIVRKIRRK